MENIVTYTKRHVDEIQNALLGVSYKRSDYDEVALIGNFLMREVKSVYLWISWLCLFASITGILRWIHIQPPKHKPHIPSDFATDDCNTEQEVVRRIQHEWVLRIAIKIFLVLSFAFLFLHMAFGWRMPRSKSKWKRSRALNFATTAEKKLHGWKIFSDWQIRKVIVRANLSIAIVH